MGRLVCICYGKLIEIICTCLNNGGRSPQDHEANRADKNSSYIRVE